MDNGPTILGPDGTPSPFNSQKAPKQVTPQEFCAMVIDSYLRDTMNAGVNPVQAIVEMGAQIPVALSEIMRQTTGLKAAAKEPMEFMLRRIAAVLWELGFKFYFAFSYREDEAQTEGDKTNEEPDASREIQGHGDEENTGDITTPGPVSPAE